MYWQEEKDEEDYVVPDDVVDLAFDMRCPALPVDHAQALHEAVCAVLPWFTDEPAAGLHLIHGADSGNGWERPEAPEALIYLSRRTKFTLRLPKARVAAARMLSGRELVLSGHRIEIGEGRERPLTTHSAQYARYVICGDPTDEDRFIDCCVRELKSLEVGFKKVLCGKLHNLELPGGPVPTRGLFIADLGIEDAVRLQQHGIGPGRHHGCGLFIPHKTINKVSSDN